MTRILALAMALGLITLAFAQSFIVTPIEEAEVVMLNPYLELPAYPGSEVLSSEIDGRDSETRFRSSASLLELYAFFHDFLVAAGWERSDLEEESSEIEASYRREGVSFQLELEREDNSYKLEIDFED